MEMLFITEFIGIINKHRVTVLLAKQSFRELQLNSYEPRLNPTD